MPEQRGTHGDPKLRGERTVTLKLQGKRTVTLNLLGKRTVISTYGENAR